MSDTFGSSRRFRDDDWWQKRDTNRLIDDMKARAERFMNDDPIFKSSYSTSTSTREYSSTCSSSNSNGLGATARKPSDPELKEQFEGKEFFEEPDQFVIKVDVSKFPVEKVQVKVLANNTLLIDAEHEEKSGDHNVVKRSLSRKFVLPDEVDSEKVASRLSGDGLLTISAPKRGAARGVERIIPVKVV